MVTIRGKSHPRNYVGNGELKLKKTEYKDDYTQVSNKLKYSNALENLPCDFQVSSYTQVYCVFNRAEHLSLTELQSGM